MFFFSSRRRHTRCSRDWSSDVCSSDLRATGPRGGRWYMSRISAERFWRCCVRLGSSSITRRSMSGGRKRSEEHTSELQSRLHLVCRLLLEKKKTYRVFVTRIYLVLTFCCYVNRATLID